MTHTTRRRWWRYLAGLAVSAALAPATAAPGQPPGSATPDAPNNEIDLFMEQVLDNRDVSWRRLGDFLLREVETLSFEAPLAVPLSGFRREYEWYVRDGEVVRSPVRFDGVELDDETRRTYEAEWLRQEQRDRRRSGRRGTISLRSRTRNIALTIERAWGGSVPPRLQRRVARDADLLGDDQAAIVLNTGAVLDALGGVDTVGFAATAAHTRDLFVMLETGRLTTAEATRALRRPLLSLVDRLDLAGGDDAALSGFVELVELAVQYGLPARDLGSYVDRAARRLATTDARTAATLDRLRGQLRTGEADQDTAAARAPGDTLLDAGRFEPRFISESYFMEFDFEPGNYYFVGRETLADREVVRIEYYPTDLFDDDPDDDDRISRGFNKTSLVTLWVDPSQHQIVKYTFTNTGLDFLPARWLVRVDDLSATMEMGQPLGDVWLPLRITVAGRAATALGDLDLRFEREFLDYREAATGGRIVDGGAPTTGGRIVDGGAPTTGGPIVGGGAPR